MCISAYPSTDLALNIHAKICPSQHLNRSAWAGSIERNVTRHFHFPINWDRSRALLLNPILQIKKSSGKSSDKNPGPLTCKSTRFRPHTQPIPGLMEASLLYILALPLDFDPTIQSSQWPHARATKQPIIYTFYKMGHLKTQT